MIGPPSTFITAGSESSLSIFSPAAGRYNYSLMREIYHITHQKDWDRAKEIGEYIPGSLAAEGFIHCSTKEQVLATANRRFPGQKDLLLLVINPKKVGAKIIFEDLRGLGEKHPHIYGELLISAVEIVILLLPDSNGQFTKLPASLLNHKK